MLAARQACHPARERRQHFPPDVARQMDAPLYFVDFLREPTTNAETGEVVDAHPSFYESIAGGLADIRSVRGPHGPPTDVQPGWPKQSQPVMRGRSCAWTSSLCWPEQPPAVLVVCLPDVSAFPLPQHASTPQEGLSKSNSIHDADFLLP